jgi:kynurenine formamidase
MPRWEPALTRAFEFSRCVTDKARSAGDVRPANQESHRVHGPCVVLDFSEKAKEIHSWFNNDGVFERHLIPRFDEFVSRLRGMEISAQDLDRALDRRGIPLEPLQGVLIYSNSARFWRASSTSETWESAYNYAPYFAEGAVARLADAGLNFVGTDSCQLEDPIGNFRTNELPFTEAASLPVEAKQNLPIMVRAAQDYWHQRSNRGLLREAGLTVYANLNIPAELSESAGRLESAAECISYSVY